MKLVVFGLSVTSSWGNGHATLWRGVLRALAHRGHDAVFFERDTPYYAAHRDLPRGEGYEVVVYPDWSDVAARAELEVASADAAMVTSFCGDAASATELVLARARRSAFYDLDTPVTLAALDRGERVPYVPERGLSEFDLVLSYTGGPALEALRARLGARRAVALYGSVDTHAHHPAARRDDYACDLSYLGTYAADRQDGVERLFLGPARHLPDQRFLLGGPMYPADMPRPPNVTWLPHVPPPEHPAFYGSSRATLNVTRAAMANLGWCPSGRLFEAAACGVPIVSDAWPGLDDFFEPGREIVVATDTADVVAALAAPASRLADVAERARRRTLSEHTAERRAEQLVRDLWGA